MEDHFAGSLDAHGGPTQSFVLVATGGVVMLCASRGATSAAKVGSMNFISVCLVVSCVPSLIVQQYLLSLQMRSEDMVERNEMTVLSIYPTPRVRGK